MKIVYCIESLVKSGGTERVLTTKLNWLAGNSAVEVWVATLEEEYSPFFALSNKVNRKMLPVSKGDRDGYKEHLGRVLCELKPDVTVHVAGMSDKVLPTLKDAVWLSF